MKKRNSNGTLIAILFLILILGAKGVQMYAKSRKEEKADDTWEH